MPRYQFMTADRKRGWRNAVSKLMRELEVDRNTAALLICRLICGKQERTPGHVNDFEFPEGVGHGNLPIPGEAPIHPRYDNPLWEGPDPFAD